MLLELHIHGPGFDQVLSLAAGEAELVLGRDPECDVSLPDPQRNISRRHLALWNLQGELHFRVLSEVNGVVAPFGEAPPGARGMLAAGQELQLSQYRISARATAAPDPDDPWAALEREASGVHPSAVAAPAEDDPFGEWGFETTFGPGATAGPLQSAALAPAADLAAFLRGLGLEEERTAVLTEGELEDIGKLVRTMVMGLLELHGARQGASQDLQAEDRTRLAPREENPLQQKWPAETKLRYLFAGRAAGAGFMSPQRAMRELVADLVAHNLASGVAARAAVEGTLGEFEPQRLKERLLGGGGKLFEGSRAWDAFAREYGSQGEDLPAWAQRMLDKYFTAAYLSERARLQREAAAGSRTRGAPGGD